MDRTNHIDSSGRGQQPRLTITIPPSNSARLYTPHPSASMSNEHLQTNSSLSAGREDEPHLTITIPPSTLAPAVHAPSGTDSNPLINSRSVAQRIRRCRERIEQIAQNIALPIRPRNSTRSNAVTHSPPVCVCLLYPSSPVARWTSETSTTARSIGQRRRRERERVERSIENHLSRSPSPPAIPPSLIPCQGPLARRPYVDPSSRHDIGHMDVAYPHCHALHWIGEKTANSSVRCPQFGGCCNHGQVAIPTLDPRPTELRNLYTGDDSDAKEFRENIREYNCALSFTSLGVQPDKSILSGRRPYVFRTHGVLYHLSGSLIPYSNKIPCYSQL